VPAIPQRRNRFVSVPFAKHRAKGSGDCLFLRFTSGGGGSSLAPCFSPQSGIVFISTMSHWPCQSSQGRGFSPQSGIVFISTRVFRAKSRIVDKEFQSPIGDCFHFYTQQNCTGGNPVQNCFSPQSGIVFISTFPNTHSDNPGVEKLVSVPNRGLFLFLHPMVGPNGWLWDTTFQPPSGDFFSHDRLAQRVVRLGCASFQSPSGDCFNFYASRRSQPTRRSTSSFSPHSGIVFISTLQREQEHRDPRTQVSVPNWGLSSFLPGFHIPDVTPNSNAFQSPQRGLFLFLRGKWRR